MIIREQGERLLAAPLDSIRHHIRKTGGSTGISAIIYYDQIGLDYSAAVTRYVREQVHHTSAQSELHFAASFAKPPKSKLPTKEDIKNFALNRSNAFFDRLDDVGLDQILQTIQEKHPHLIHGHPSTLYALSCYVEKKFGTLELFKIFESSGELFQPYMREKIAKVFKCKTIDRYGLAEFGIIAYELDGYESGLQVLDSEGWAESRAIDDNNELVFTGFHNRLMPLIRYTTGDMAKVEEGERGLVLTNVVGRIHDMVTINGVVYPTHNIMDVMDHVIGGIQEFQIDMRSDKPLVRIAAEPNADIEQIRSKIVNYWQNALAVEFVGHEDFIRIGRHAKFRHVVK
jgi:phenylacetate-CoA ligase